MADERSAETAAELDDLHRRPHMIEVTDEMLEAVVWVLTHEDESIDTKIILAVAPLIEAQARAAAIEEAAKLVEDGWRCMTCGSVFLGANGHECERPDWDGVTSEQMAAAIRALSRPVSEREGADTAHAPAISGGEVTMLRSLVKELRKETNRLIASMDGDMEWCDEALEDDAEAFLHRELAAADRSASS